jgi:phage major head subunit gpT-like protein
MITPAAFAVFVTTVNTMIGQAYATTPLIYQRFVTTIPMDSLTLEFGWTGMIAKPRVWTGPRTTVQPAPQTYTVDALPYELTVELDRFRLDDTKFNLYYRVLPDMARQTKRLPEYWIRDMLQGIGAETGTRANGLDGTAHWNTAHSVDIYDTTKGTYSNDATGGGFTYNGVTIGGAMSPNAVATSVEYMRVLKGEDNESLGITPDLILIPALLELETSLILKSMFFSPPSWGAVTGQVGAADNPIRRFGVDYLVNPLLDTTSATNATKNWYLLDTTKAIKPFVWGLREAPRLVPRVDENDPIVFDEHKYMWGAWGRATPAWGFAWLSLRSGP